MRPGILAVLLVSLVLSACGSKDAELSATSAGSSLDSLPVTIEGEMYISVEEGDEDGHLEDHEYTLGLLEVGDDSVDVEISGAQLRAAQLSGDGGRVRATLDSKKQLDGSTVYTVSALQKL